MNFFPWIVSQDDAVTLLLQYLCAFLRTFDFFIRMWADEIHIRCDFVKSNLLITPLLFSCFNFSTAMRLPISRNGSKHNEMRHASEIFWTALFPEPCVTAAPSVVNDFYCVQSKAWSSVNWFMLSRIAWDFAQNPTLDRKNNAWRCWFFNMSWMLFSKSFEMETHLLHWLVRHCLIGQIAFVCQKLSSFRMLAAFITINKSSSRHTDAFFVLIRYEPLPGKKALFSEEQICFQWVCRVVSQSAFEVFWWVESCVV